MPQSTGTLCSRFPSGTDCVHYIFKLGVAHASSRLADFAEANDTWILAADDGLHCFS
jgi:hypothetical protein